MKVKEALVGSFKILREKPKFMLPMILPLILGVGIVGLTLAAGIPITIQASTGGMSISSSTEEVTNPPGWYLLSVFVLIIIVLVIGILVYGMYSSMVKDHLEKKELDLKASFLFACHKFWSLLGALLLAGLIMGIVSDIIGFVVSFIPTSSISADVQPTIMAGSIITFFLISLITVFFYYIPPAIIMDDLKAVDGFQRSCEFGKKNYLFTFLVSLLPILIGGAIYGLLIGLPVYLSAGIDYILILLIPYGIISLFIGQWVIIVQSYAYYGLRA